MQLNSLAIITARGGSKRIPGKNKKLFLGKPIILYSIEAAIESKLFNEVMVSTDDLEIADIAKQAGAAVPFLRSEKTSNDYATTNDVLLEVLKAYEELGKTFDFMSCIYPTAPFVTADKLKKAYAILIDSQADCLMPVVSFSFPPQRGMIVRNGCLAYSHPENRVKRSQDLEKIYHDCGQFYIYRVSKFLECKGSFEGGYIPFFLSETEVQDIDELSDWEIAELKYQIMMKKTKP